MCVAEMRHHAAPQPIYVHVGTQTDYTFSAPAPVVEYNAAAPVADYTTPAPAAHAGPAVFVSLYFSVL